MYKALLYFCSLACVVIIDGSSSPASSLKEDQDHLIKIQQVIDIIIPPRRLYEEIEFTKHLITTDADRAEAVFAIDVDGDGDIDVLSASYDDDTIAWYENDGNQGFTKRAITTDADAPFAVFAIDVDGDGDIDVLSASFNDDTIAWYENDGNQGFTKREITSGADGARAVFAIDVDGDGDIDVLSASFHDNTIAWYENDGNQGFTKHEVTTDANGAYAVFAIDFDGDGDIDVLSASWSDSTIAWYENDGNEGFTKYEIITDANKARAVFAIDVDGDGDIDVLSASRNDNTIAWYENDGNQGLTKRAITTDALGAGAVFAIDVDGDGDIDVLSASENDDTIAWYENDGNQGFTKRAITTDADGAETVFAIDVDGDGDIDVLSASSYDDTIAWYENLMPTEWSASPTLHPTPRPTPKPTPMPTLFPTLHPTPNPTPKPTPTPTPGPTDFEPPSRTPLPTPPPTISPQSGGGSKSGADSTPIIAGAAAGGAVALLGLCVWGYFCRRAPWSLTKATLKEDDEEAPAAIRAQSSLLKKNEADAARKNAKATVQALLTAGQILPVFGECCRVAKDILSECEKSSERAQDIVAAGERVCNTVKLLDLFNKNSDHFQDDSAKALIKQHMCVLRDLLLEFQDAVASYGKESWLRKKWLSIARESKLTELDHAIVEVLGQLRDAYHLGRDEHFKSHIASLLQEQAYNLEAAMKEQIETMVNNKHISADVAAAELADDISALNTVADRANIEESEVDNERMRIRQKKQEVMEDSEIKIDEMDERPFARGGQAQIYKGVYSGVEVAIKRVELGDIAEEQRDKIIDGLRTELNIMVKLNSPLVVRVYGIVTKDMQYIDMVMEYMSGHSLRRRLDDKNGYPDIDEKTRLLWCRNIAHGMKFLYDKGVKHCDLKANNCLLDSSDNVKITDFGLAECHDLISCIKTCSTHRGGPRGTVAFMAPEIIKGEGFTEKSDVYSYGMTLYEIVTRERPWAGISHEVRILYAVANDQERPALPSNTLLYKLIKACWAHEPEQRPTFVKILEKYFGYNSGSKHKLSFFSSSIGASSKSNLLSSSSSVELRDGSTDEYSRASESA